MILFLFVVKVFFRYLFPNFTSSSFSVIVDRKQTQSDLLNQRREEGSEVKPTPIPPRLRILHPLGVSVVETFHRHDPDTEAFPDHTHYVSEFPGQDMSLSSLPIRDTETPQSLSPEPSPETYQTSPFFPNPACSQSKDRRFGPLSVHWDPFNESERTGVEEVDT